MSSQKVNNKIKETNSPDSDCLSCKIVTSGVFFLMATYLKISAEDKPRPKKLPMYFAATVCLTAAVGSLMDNYIRGAIENITAKPTQKD